MAAPMKRCVAKLRNTVLSRNLQSVKDPLNHLEPTVSIKWTLVVIELRCPRLHNLRGFMREKVNEKVSGDWPGLK